MENMEIYEKAREVPKNAQKTISAGRTKGFTDINPMWRIKKLTELFGVCGFGWYYIVTRKWTEGTGNEICAFVDIDLFVKNGDEWSKAIHGTGGSKLATSERSGVYVSDECYKMATTDAISVACKQLGIGADVYWQQDATKYSNADKSEQKPSKITDTEKAILKNLCEKKGWPIEKVFPNGIDNLTSEQYAAAVKKLAG